MCGRGGGGVFAENLLLRGSSNKDNPISIGGWETSPLWSMVGNMGSPEQRCSQNDPREIVACWETSNRPPRNKIENPSNAREWS